MPPRATMRLTTMRLLTAAICSLLCVFAQATESLAQHNAPQATLSVPSSPVVGNDKASAPYQLRVVGGLAGLNQYTRHEEPFWTQRLSQLSGGKYTATIVPFDRAGVPGAEMFRLLQLGVVPFGTALLSSFTSQYPEFTAPDLAGLNPDIATLKTTLSAFRPHLEKTLRDQYGIEALAVYVYPAQVVFCKRPMTHLKDLAGRRVRVSSSTQADFVNAFGGVPVHVEFNKIVSNITSGNTECAITGTASGNTLGLHKVTSHIHSLPINWGLAVFGVHRPVWLQLPQDLRQLLQQELPKLEAAIWVESERETAQGLACNRGDESCLGGDKGSMVMVPVSAQDERQRREILNSTVVPSWLKRCGARCADIWNQTIGPVRGIKAVPRP